MPIQGRTDAYGDKPKIPQDRFLRGTVKLSANAMLFPNATIGFATNAVTNAGIANGWTVAGTNIGNTIGTIGFNQIAPYVISFTSNTVTLSQNAASNVPAGQVLTFSKLILNRANTRSSANAFNSNTYMVTTTRLVNASPGVANATTHVGWNHVKHFTGFVSSVTFPNGGKGYLPANSNTQWLTITANNTFGGNALSANIGFTTNANGSLAFSNVWTPGSGYTVTPTTTTGGINAVAQRYISSASVTLGGYGYSNGTVLTLTGGTGSGANVVAYVNTAGSLISANVQASGGGWGSTAPTAAVPAGGSSNATVSLTMANGANATLVTTMGGRANRIHVQTLVALSNSSATVTTSGGLDYPGL